MSENEGRRKRGRFFRKDDPILGVIAINPFSLEDICSKEMILSDNPNASIIHSSLHDLDALQRGIRNSAELERDLMTPEMRRPVLRPLDFTEEWKRQKRRNNAKNQRLDEEDELERELEYLTKRRGKDGGDEAAPPAPDGFVPLAGAPKSHDAAEPPEAPSEDEAAIHPTSTGPNFKIQRETMDTVAHAISQLVEPETESDTTHEEEAAHTALDTAPEMVEEEPAPVVTAPEREAMKTYQKELAERRELSQRDKEMVEEAKAKGYQEGYQSGFQVGEEKAALQSQQTNMELAESLSDLLEAMAGLKTSILNNAQDNFRVLCQAMMESLLKREFEIQPESFATVVNRAIKEAVPDDQFKVRVHPDTLARLEQVADERLQSRLVADDSVEPLNFRIDSSLTVVDGNVSQLVKDLLDQADISLFEDKEQAG